MVKELRGLKFAEGRRFPASHAAVAPVLRRCDFLKFMRSASILPAVPRASRPRKWGRGRPHDSSRDGGATRVSQALSEVEGCPHLPAERRSACNEWNCLERAMRYLHYFSIASDEDVWAAQPARTRRPGLRDLCFRLAARCRRQPRLDTCMCKSQRLLEILDAAHSRQQEPPRAAITPYD